MWSIFALLWFQRNLILLFSRYKTLCKTQKNMWIPFILLGPCLLGKWRLVDCFHCEFRVSAQIMVLDYCIAKCKKFSGHFFLWFKIFVLITTLVTWKKKNSSQVYLKDFVHRCRTKNSKMHILHVFFKDCVIELELPSLKRDFFEIFFWKFCW